MQFTKKALAVAIITVVGVLSPGSTSALHTPAGDGVGDQRHGSANEMTVSNYSKEVEYDWCIFGGAPSFGSFFGGNTRQHSFFRVGWLLVR